MGVSSFKIQKSAYEIVLYQTVRQFPVCIRNKTRGYTLDVNLDFSKEVD